MKKHLLFTLVILAFLSNSLIFAADSTTLWKSIPNSKPMYWSCTNTKLIVDPARSGYWYQAEPGGPWGTTPLNILCNNAGAGANPPNSIPYGLFFFPTKYPGWVYLVCGHLEPICQWTEGPPPPKGLNT